MKEPDVWGFRQTLLNFEFPYVHPTVFLLFSKDWWGKQPLSLRMHDGKVIYVSYPECSAQRHIGKKRKADMQGYLRLMQHPDSENVQLFGGNSSPSLGYDGTCF